MIKIFINVSCSGAYVENMLFSEFPETGISPWFWCVALIQNLCQHWKSMCKGRRAWNAREQQKGEKVLTGVLCLFVTHFPLRFVFWICGCLEIRGCYILVSFIRKHGIMYPKATSGYIAKDGVQHLFLLPLQPEFWYYTHYYSTCFIWHLLWNAGIIHAKKAFKWFSYHLWLKYGPLSRPECLLLKFTTKALLLYTYAFSCSHSLTLLKDSHSLVLWFLS